MKFHRFRLIQCLTNKFLGVLNGPLKLKLTQLEIRVLKSSKPPLASSLAHTEQPNRQLL